MGAIEFITELNGSAALAIPPEVSARLPKSGRVRVLVVSDDDDDSAWRDLAYTQFLRDEPPEDAIYDTLA